MERIRQFKPLIIEDKEQSACGLARHTQNYFEIVYVCKGSGDYHLNDNIHPYTPGDLFLLAPEDRHHFQIKKTTRFALIKFTDNYFSSKHYLSSDEFLMSDPGTIMRHSALKESKLKLGDPCKSIIKNTIANILIYNNRKDAATSPIVFFLILSILALVKETLTKQNIHLTGSTTGKEQFISYIHQHIYEPEKMQIKNIAVHFNIAPAYFSAWFRRHFGVSYRGYITDLRKTLIEKRMASGKLTLKEIAAEFGFTDQSHLSHFIKAKMPGVHSRRTAGASFRRTAAGAAA